jgi:hypothetical protein
VQLVIAHSHDSLVEVDLEVAESDPPRHGGTFFAVSCSDVSSQVLARLVIALGPVYCDIVKFRRPLVIAFSALLTIFFQYEIRYTHSIWIEFVGGLIIYVVGTVAYVFLFERKTSHETDGESSSAGSKSVI